MSSESSTPTTDSQPTSPLPASPASCVSQAPAWLPNALTNVSSTLLAGWAISKVAAFLPQALAFIVRDGKISTDVIAWAPLGLTLLALVAIASPVSLGPLITLIRSVLPGKAQSSGNGG